MALSLSIPPESQTNKPEEYTMIPMHELGSALSPKLLGSPSLVLKTSWSEGRTPVHYGPLTAGDLYQALLSPVVTSFTGLRKEAETSHSHLGR